MATYERKVSTTHTKKFGKAEQIVRLNFDDVTSEEVLELAIRSLVIHCQGKARAAKTKEDWKAALHMDLSVRDYIDRRPTRKPDEEKVADFLKGKTQEEQARILQAAQAMLEQDKQ